MLSKQLLFGSLLALLILDSGLVFGVDSPGEPKGVAISFDAERGRFAVSGLSPAEARQLRGGDEQQLAARFSVRIENSSEVDVPPLFGEYRWEADRLTFEPRYPLRPGMAYRAVYRRAAGGVAVSEQLFRIPAVDPPPPARVEYVFPSQSVLPENQLKFYLHFSAPMSRGQAYQRVHLYRASGEEVELPFLRLDEELWDYAGMRFTLLFDPGRIKRGLKPREEMGPALEEGEEYRFVIDREWQDASGQPLARRFVKRFRVTAPDDQQPDPSQWRLQRPAAGSKDPLVVELHEPLDHAMLMRVVEIADAAGQAIPALRVVDRHERRLSLLPDLPWVAGRYSLVVQTNLEDLAGNSIRKPFEVDLFEQVEQRITAEFHRIPFDIE